MKKTLYREARKIFPFLDIKNCSKLGIAFKTTMPDDVMKILFMERPESEDKALRNMLHDYADNKRLERAGFRRTPCLGKPLNPFSISFTGELC